MLSDPDRRFRDTSETGEGGGSCGQSGSRIPITGVKPAFAQNHHAYLAVERAPASEGEPIKGFARKRSSARYGSDGPGGLTGSFAAGGTLDDFGAFRGFTGFAVF